MIGKADWFKRRKYGGWGITPKTWQGFVYIILFILPIILFHSLQLWDIKTRIIITIVWLLILLIDTFNIMVHLKKDERSRMHEAIAERNALWGTIVILIAGLLYQLIKSALSQTIKIDWWIVGALFVALIIKSISNFYLERKN